MLQASRDDTHSYAEIADTIRARCVNPMPDKDRESKTWLTQESGPIDSLETLLAYAAYFSLNPTQALEVLAQVLDAVEGWRAIAVSTAIGLQPRELADFENAFEHEALEHSRKALGRHNPVRTG